MGHDVLFSPPPLLAQSDQSCEGGGEEEQGKVFEACFTNECTRGVRERGASFLISRSPFSQIICHALLSPSPSPP